MLYHTPRPKRFPREASKPGMLRAERDKESERLGSVQDKKRLHEKEEPGGIVSLSERIYNGEGEERPGKTPVKSAWNAPVLEDSLPDVSFKRRMCHVQGCVRPVR